MRKMAVATVLACLCSTWLCFSAFAGAREAGSRRVMTAEYTAPGGVMGTGGTLYGQGSTLGGVTFDAGPRHRSVRIRIEDRAGLPVSASVRVDDDGDGKEDRSREICGSTGEPLAVAPGASVKVLIFAGPCADGTPAAATQGTVFATFGRQ